MVSRYQMKRKLWKSLGNILRTPRVSLQVPGGEAWASWLNTATPAACWMNLRDNGSAAVLLPITWRNLLHTFLRTIPKYHLKSYYSYFYVPGLREKCFPLSFSVAELYQQYKLQRFQSEMLGWQHESGLSSNYWQLGPLTRTSQANNRVWCLQLPRGSQAS